MTHSIFFRVSAATVSSCLQRHYLDNASEMLVYSDSSSADSRVDSVDRRSSVPAAVVSKWMRSDCSTPLKRRPEIRGRPRLIGEMAGSEHSPRWKLPPGTLRPSTSTFNEKKQCADDIRAERKNVFKNIFNVYTVRLRMHTQVLLSKCLCLSDRLSARPSNACIVTKTQ